MHVKKGPVTPNDPTSVYSCVGPKAKDFPGKEGWLTFDQLWEINEPVIKTANGGDEYIDDLQAAIKEVASDSKVDARLILAIIQQESSGNVSIHCTEDTACGLMQHRGSTRFDPSSPRTSIKAMIEDGIYGTSSVPGFLSYFNCDASSPSELTWVNTQLINGNPYAAAHVYNTGHIDNEDLSTDSGKSNYYAHDILSRLQGWNGWKAGLYIMTGADQLPAASSLFIATSSAIYAHSSSAGDRTLFECASDGIVNARPAKDNSSLLAVADSQLVIFHDPARRGDKKYALKSYEGEPRLLVFSPDSRILYFTTTLSTSIQAYCIPTGELLPPPQIHSSPPNILSISPDGNILLSASPAPPKIYLQDLRSGGSASVSFQPADARSPAAFATFQSNGTTIPSHTSFLLGFQDGTLSLYRLALPTCRQSYQNVYHDQRQALLLRPTRHVDAPATCLAILSTGSLASRGRSDVHELLGGGSTREDSDGKYEGTEIFIAIGCQTGNVIVFNMIGLLVYKVEMGLPIVALDWKSDMSTPSVLPNQNRSLSTCFEDREEDYPVLKLGHVGDTTDETKANGKE
ncbi:hypothetical protein SLS60_000179 [Paraconiothyrium brasiliense]|uniref:Transglycosylase SLT domain-containing protein n=1 Tax=Paraconiothyrium brasiliense TaxID=300254 RepID=A0ABR3S5J6_9PLEO